MKGMKLRKEKGEKDGKKKNSPDAGEGVK